jgi:hypothetical protein
MREHLKAVPSRNSSQRHSRGIRHATAVAVGAETDTITDAPTVALF